MRIIHNIQVSRINPRLLKMIESKCTAHQAAAWMRKNVSPRRIRANTFFSPNMTELRRWLNDKSIPVCVRKHVYQWILYRQARVMVRRHGVEHPSVVAGRHAYRRQDRLLRRAAQWADRQLNAANRPAPDHTWGRRVIDILLGRSLDTVGDL